MLNNISQRVKYVLFCSIILIVSPSYAAVVIDGITFHTKEEYWADRRPCACPNDPAQNGRCGKRAALCKAGGKHIINCDSTVIKTFSDYNEVQKKLCR